MGREHGHIRTTRPNITTTTMPIYIFRARITTNGTVSIEADTIDHARELRQSLNENDSAVVNIEIGSGDTLIDATGYEESDPDDGTHYMQTPRENAEENARAIEDEGAFDNDVCPSAPRPLEAGNTAHKWAEMPVNDDEGNPVILCDECGAERDEDIHTA